MALLTFFFFVTALLYAAVGFGGGSTYNALLVLQGADYLLIPSIALVCNVIVVTGGVWRFSCAGHLPLRALTPFIVTSIPAAWIGGRIPVSETFFIGALGFALLAAGLQLVFEQRQKSDAPKISETPLPLALAVGVALGFLAGLVGIGGGIFLAPILYLLRWGTPRDIAGACSFFILVNSLAGLIGQTMKLGDLGALNGFLEYWPLFLAVLIGGQIGSHLGSVGLSAVIIKRLTAVLILYVAARLLLRWFGVVF